MKYTKVMYGSDIKDRLNAAVELHKFEMYFTNDDGTEIKLVEMYEPHVADKLELDTVGITLFIISGHEQVQIYTDEAVLLKDIQTR